MNNRMLLVIQLSNPPFSIHPLLLQLSQIFLILKHCIITAFVSNSSILVILIG